jgi:hypothetical protein
VSLTKLLDKGDRLVDKVVKLVDKVDKGYKVPTANVLLSLLVMMGCDVQQSWSGCRKHHTSKLQAELAAAKECRWRRLLTFYASAQGRTDFPVATRTPFLLTEEGVAALLPYRRQ